VRNAAVTGDAITLVVDRPPDVARGDPIASVDAAPDVSLGFDAKLVALKKPPVLTPAAALGETRDRPQAGSCT
jgi:sulfate adenylyltransferase subunit 1 (EFTu-like GTPase family)